MKSYAKANIFLKIIGFDTRNYHLINSRFVLLENLYDELFFSDEKHEEGFEILSEFKCDENIISKAFKVLCEQGFENVLKEFFKTKSIKLIKNIPTCAGLGGGSSNCASFLKMINEELNLKLSTQDLIQISLKLGSDIAFFLSGFKSANVKGRGEILEEFDDNIPNLDWIFPAINCHTQAVYKAFDESYFDLNANLKLAQYYENLSTTELLNYKNTDLNDLFIPCTTLYPKMSPFLEQNFFLSGSGSSVFKVKK